MILGKVNIKSRQAEGIAAAKAKGKHLGRPEIGLPANWEIVYNTWRSKKITAVKAMQLLNLKKNTFYKLAKQYSFKS